MSDLNKLLIEFSTSGSSQIKPDRQPKDVYLYVYDLTDQLDFWRKHSLRAYAKLRGFPEKSIAYTSVVVYDQEFTYGPNGVVITPANDHINRPNAVNMYWRGKTALTISLVTKVVESLITDSCFLPQLFELNRNNSNHFADALLREIVGCGLPADWTHMTIDQWILDFLPEDLVRGKAIKPSSGKLQFLPPAIAR